ncbi:MAG: dTDP-4-dehydrorhamnose 3,5-epimerase family protein [Candidatus Parcubacteria bacterium]|nr:dTDP-4-dehydrorhamnose 3,5-epimerase family protein [Candidatus Parcubacteria bacterium]
MEFITLANKNSVNLVEDVLMYPLKVNRDESGILVEALRTDWKEIYGKDREFAMQYFSVTDSGVARDETVWHCHPNQEDRFLVAQGEIIVAVADNRQDSQTLGLLNLFHMKADMDPYTLLIPKGALHGFLVVSRSPAVLLNFPTRLYSLSEEQRIAYKEARIKQSDGSLFSWNQVRKEFKLTSRLDLL